MYYDLSTQETLFGRAVKNASLDWLGGYNKAGRTGYIFTFYQKGLMAIQTVYLKALPTGKAFR